MKPKAFAGFVAVTAVVTMAAMITVAQRYGGNPAAVSVQPFPGLIDRVNDVAEIDIRAHDGTTIIHRVGNGWGLADKHDYPVQSDLVRKTVIGFGEMRLTEKKTERPDRYPRLAVEDVDKEGAKSRLVTLKTADGKSLAEMIVGRQKTSPMGGPSGLYVRRPGEAQSWLAGSVGFGIPENPVLWLEQRIIHVNGKRVSRITIAQPDGEKLVVTKSTPDDPHFAFPELPEGEHLKGDAVADDLTQILMVVDLVDVALQSEVEFPEGKTWKAAVETFDGLVTTVEIVDRDGKPWAKFHAEAKPVAGELPTYKGEAAAFLKEASEVKKEAEEINARTGAWAYELKDWQAQKMQSKLAWFLEKETEQPPPVEAPSGASMPDFGPGGESGAMPGMGGGQ
jgi:hypothetical protein